jgi:hypothetical protein
MAAHGGFRSYLLSMPRHRQNVSRVELPELGNVPVESAQKRTAPRSWRSTLRRKFLRLKRWLTCACGMCSSPWAVCSVKMGDLKGAQSTDGWPPQHRRIVCKTPYLFAPLGYCVFWRPVGTEASDTSALYVFRPMCLGLRRY